MTTGKITLNTLAKMKHNKQKFACLTCYDASFTQILNKLKVDLILVGDSLGNVIQGQESTVPVTIDDMVYHTQCVSRQNTHSLLIADLPFMTYSNPKQALQNAGKLMQAGAEMVKFEGGEWLCDTIIQLTRQGVPVCAHLGLTPQSVHVFGGYLVQGKTIDSAKKIIHDAKALQDAGARMLVLECVPTQLAEEISLMLDIPVMGIGAGPYCDGQVLVLYDMLGITTQALPKLAKNFLAEANGIEQAIENYINAVKQGTFPGPENGY